MSVIPLSPFLPSQCGSVNDYVFDFHRQKNGPTFYQSQAIVLVLQYLE
jgi:hypothetical protein